MESNLKQSDEEYNKGWDLEEQGKYEQALEHWDQAIILNPNDSIAYKNKGNALKELGQYQQAIECYNKAIELDQNYSYAWNGKGNALYQLGQLQQAIKCFNKAIKLDQNYTNAWNNKGLALYDLGQYQQAIECYQKTIKLNSENSIYFFNQGLVLEKLNRNEEAIQSYKALKLNPNYQDTKKKLSDLESKLQIKEENKVSEIKLKKQQQSTFIKELSQIDQNKIAGDFFSKLSQNAAFNWVSKFSVIQSNNLKEFCSYYALILPFIISQDQKDNIEIEQYNVIKAGFANIHYGIYQDETIAIKEQLLDQNNDAYFIQLLREIAILAFCDHPNIPKIKGIYFNPQSFKIWIIQERYYMNLFQAITFKKKIPKKKQLIVQLLETLDYIHSIGLIHLDLKSKNILFNSQKYKKLLLIDFGISKIAKLEQTDVLGLSYGYNAPEVSIQQKSALSSKADMFSFAIILYEFITEKRAWKNFAGKDSKLVYQLIQGGFDFFKENDKTGNQDLDRLILDCVNKNADQRPSAKEALERIQAIQF